MTMVDNNIHTLERTLAAVDDAVAATLQQLADDWAVVAGRPSDILGTDDVPRLAQLGSGGKRVRPAMVHWGWVASGADEHRHPLVVRLGVALELLHLFALVHDDIMDRSEQRRGRAATHAIARDAHVRAGGHGEPVDFGHNIAILVGDLVHAEADHLVADLPADVRQIWRTMMIELVLGQRRDLTGAALGRRDLEHALEVAVLKTGSYTVGRPLEMGAVLGGASPATLACLSGFGVHLGRAFGLRDDILGMWGDPAKTGKSSDDDLVGGKATVLLALAAERLSDEGRRRLEHLGTGELAAEELAELRTEMAECGIREEVEQLISDEVDTACAQLEGGHVPAAAVEGLTQMAQKLAWRQA